MLSVKWDLLTFLLITVTVFSTPSIAADQDPTLPEISTLTGQLEILILDNFETGNSERRYAIRVKQADGEYRLVSLSFASIIPDSTLRTGEQVSVGGRWIDDTLAIDSLQRADIAPSDRIMRATGADRYAPLTIGDRKAVVLILNMRNRDTDVVAENTYGSSDLDSMMYTGTQNVKSLYEASSYQQLSFDPNTDGTGGHDIFGPFTIEYSPNDDCTVNNQQLNTILDQWATDADTLATAQGIDLTQYEHRIYFLPSEVGCGWKGMGSEACTGNACRVWVIKDTTNTNEGRYIAHELGHNLSWRHAASDPDNDGVFAPKDEYGDKSGIMGWPVWAQANAPHRDQLEWFDAYPGTLVTAECSRQYQLHALELDPGVDNVGIQVVKIHKPDTNEYYYLSYRRQIGPYPSNSDYADQINIHRYDGNWSYTYHITNLQQDGVFRDTTNGITVTATSAGGATATVRVNTRNAAPEAAFSHNLVDGHLKVQFTNHSSDDKDSIESYQWEINGETLTDENPEYTFPDSGTYPVTLTVTDTCGRTHEASYDVVVTANERPTAEFTVDANNLSVQFTDTCNDDDGTIELYQWDFGDSATSAEASPSHTYANSGTYDVTLTVTDDDGATAVMTETIQIEANKPPKANFTVTANGLEVNFNDTSEDTDGTISSRQWKFVDDGSVSDLADPSHVYASAGTHSVQLTVTDDDGTSDTEIKEVTVNLTNVAPTADFTPKADRLSVVFTDTSTDSDGDIASRLWDFGDNVTSTEANPSHTFASAGTYAVSLTVTDNLGVSDTVNKNVTVDVNNVPPVAAFTYTTDGEEIQFSDTSTDSDGDIASSQWDFGDGATSTETSPMHTYTSPGTYEVQLTVTDDDGETNTFSDNVDVEQISPLVVPDSPSGGGGGGGGCFIGNLF